MNSSAYLAKELPSEMLLEVFKRLNCQQMVKTRRVWKEWGNIINQNRSLWRRLILTEEKDCSELEEILRYTSGKNQDSMTEVSVSLQYQGFGDDDRDQSEHPHFNLSATLLRSNETLRIIHLSFLTPELVSPVMAALLFNLRQVIDFRLVNKEWTHETHPLIEVQDIQFREEQKDRNSSLKVLGLSLIHI